MEKYDYRESMKKDIIDWIELNDVLEEAKEQEWTYQQLFDWLHEELWDKDEITGNGPYFYDTEENCSEYLCHNFDLAYEATRNFCIDDCPEALIKQYENGSLARYFDCTIRCDLLAECIGIALDELGVKEE